MQADQLVRRIEFEKPFNDDVPDLAIGPDHAATRVMGSFLRNVPGQGFFDTTADPPRIVWVEEADVEVEVDHLRRGQGTVEDPRDALRPADRPSREIHVKMAKAADRLRDLLDLANALELGLALVEQGFDPPALACLHIPNSARPVKTELRPGDDCEVLKLLHLRRLESRPSHAVHDAERADDVSLDGDLHAGVKTDVRRTEDER